MAFASVHQTKNQSGDSKTSISAKPFSNYSNDNSLRDTDHFHSIHLQHTPGNQAVCGLKYPNTGFDFTGIGIQPKLKVSQPGDAHEQEADRVAEQVMQMSVSDSIGPMAVTTDEKIIDRKCTACETKKKDRKDEKFRISRKSSTLTNLEITDEITNEINSIHSSDGSSIDNATIEFMESRFGYDFSNVRIHTGEMAARSSSSINALAYTIGDDIVFGEGQYQPNTLEGRRLLAHELTHVLQQVPIATNSCGLKIEAETSTQELHARNATSPVPRSRTAIAFAAPGKQFIQRVTLRSDQDTMDASQPIHASPDALDYARIASDIYDAMAGLGTDEEKVYRALQILQHDQTAIDRLKSVYRNRYAEDLVEDLYDDFSGGELDYALELLNLGTKKSPKEVEGKTTSLQQIDEAAQQIWQAVEGPGTDEEAIFSALLPLGRSPNLIFRLEEAYRRISDGEELRSRLFEELSGSELDYALSLLEVAYGYEYYVREAAERLSGRIGFGLSIGEFCGLETEGQERGAFDEDYWIQHSDEYGCRLRLLPGKRPSEAIEMLFSRPGRWKVDCAQFVELPHLYAQLRVEGPYAFDRRYQAGPFELKASGAGELKSLVGSTGIRSLVLYQRRTPADVEMVPHVKRGGRFMPDATIPKRGVNDLLLEVPAGSRVMWTNELLFRSTDSEERAFLHENAIKLSQDAFAAHPLSAGILFWTRHVLSRHEIEHRMADTPVNGTRPDHKMALKHVFVSEIEIYDTPLGTSNWPRTRRAAI